MESAKEEIGKNVTAVTDHKKETEKSKQQINKASMLMTYFPPLKPIIYFNDPERAIKELFKHGSAFCVEKDYDGLKAFVHKKGNTVTFYNELGKDITGYFDTTIGYAKQLSLSDFVLECDIMEYDGKKPVIMQEIGSKGFREESLIFHVSDLLYLDKELSEDPWISRRKKMESLFKWNNRFKQAPVLTVSNEKETLKAVTLMASLKGLKGVIIKNYDSPYKMTSSRYYSIVLPLGGVLSGSTKETSVPIKP